MKFSNKYLPERPIMSCTNTVQLREIRDEGDRIYIYSVPYREDSRAITGTVIEIFISSPRPDIFRIQARHFAGSRVKMPEYELNEAPVQLRTEENEAVFTVFSGEARLEIRRNPAHFSFYIDADGKDRRDRTLT